MRRYGLGMSILALTVIGSVAIAGAASADGAKLVKNLTDDLGITEDQAIGGTKALLGVAKNNLGDDEYKELLSGNAGLKDVSAREVAAKAAKRMTGDHEGHMMGEGVGDSGLASLASNADLVKEFGDLGMDSGMIEKFTGKLLDLVGGDGPGSGLLSPKTRLLRKGLGLL